MLSAILTGSTTVLLVAVAFWHLSRRLRAHGRNQIAARFPAAELLRAETLAQSYGQQSRGVAQLAGSGALALTNGELYFLLYVPERELHIPLGSVKAVSIVRSHLGKWGGAKLLHVLFTREGSDDAIAWRLTDPDGWKAQIDAMRA